MLTERRISAVQAKKQEVVCSWKSVLIMKCKSYKTYNQKEAHTTTSAKYTDTEIGLNKDMLHVLAWHFGSREKIQKGNGLNNQITYNRN